MLHRPDQPYLATCSDEDVKHVNASALSAISKLCSQKGDTLRLGGKASTAVSSCYSIYHITDIHGKLKTALHSNTQGINAYKHQTTHFGTLKVLLPGLKSQHAVVLPVVLLLTAAAVQQADFAELASVALLTLHFEP